MNFSLSSENYQTFNGDCIVLFYAMGEVFDKALSQTLSLMNFEAKLAQTAQIFLPSHTLAKRIIVAGLGKKEKLDLKAYHKTLVSVMDIVGKMDIKTLWLDEVKITDVSAYDILKNSTRIIADSFYVFAKPYKNAHDEEKLNIPSEACFYTKKKQDKARQSSLKDALCVGLATAEAMVFAKDLANLPSNICTPTYLAKSAQKLAENYKIECEILGHKEMSALGMNSLLSVAKGSDEAPKLISLHYRGANEKNKAPIVLIGKGVTFDTGGISLKGSQNMDEMKYDMCGAASVLGAIKAAAQLKLAMNLSVIVPAVENMPSAHASKPGDVVQTLSGQSVEILNTDAEGRLILCDAITYCERLNPSAVIDVATLTGAVIVALGKSRSGVMSNNQILADALMLAGNSSLDEIWQLPLGDEYDEMLKSNFADMANIGGREAGSIVAGCFLARFAKNLCWAHLDIAGVAWTVGDKKGATGRPVPLLVDYLIHQV